MARNGSGVYSVPNVFSPGDTILSSDHNENFTDLGNEITNSLAIDGQSTMTGQLKLANGTVSAPAVAFGSDTDTGTYRSGANEFSVSAGGTRIAKFSSSGVDVTTGRVLQGGFTLIPPGLIAPYAGSTAPDGWLLCYGQEVSRTTYADLFAVLSTTYGAGDSSTTFNLPDYRGRVIAGKDDMGGTSANRLTNQSGGLNGDTLGAAGGSETHTLTEAQLASHTHTLGNFNGNSVNVLGGNTRIQLSAPNGGDSIVAPSSYGFAVGSTGSGSAHNNVQPTIIANYIIKY